MTFISYAQNMEDVILWRALKGIGQGFYIDVGANDPNQDSVTKAFYDRGWRGINIEPVGEWYEKLQKDRPDDINLKIAVGARKGDLDFYEIPGTGLSTSNELFSKQHEQERGYTARQIKVPVNTLTAICEQYAQPDIHFLKIDVEGDEKSVLEGIDFSRIRPWIVIVESTIPNRPIENYQDWEQILLKADYKYAYFDGLNRFYLEKEHLEFLAAFNAPPNCFDHYKLYAHHKAEERGQLAEAQLHAVEVDIAQERERLDQALALANQAGIRVEQTEAKILAAEANAAQANERLDQALALANQAEMRAEQTEAKILVAEANAARANKRLDQALVLVNQAEARLKQAEVQIHTAEENTAQTNERLGQTLTLANQAEIRAEQAELKATQANERAKQAKVQIDTAEESVVKANERADRAETLAKQADAAAHSALIQYQTVINSRIWRMTAPLRWVGEFIKWFARGSIAWLTLKPGSRPQRTARVALLHLRNWVLLRPRVKAKVLLILQRFPRILAWLERLHFVNPIQAIYSPVPPLIDDVSESFECSLPDGALDNLSPRARKICMDMQLVMARHHQESN